MKKLLIGYFILIGSAVGQVFNGMTLFSPAAGGGGGGGEFQTFLIDNDLDDNKSILLFF